MVDVKVTEAARGTLGNRVSHVVSVRIDQAQVRGDWVSRERCLPGNRGIEMLRALRHGEGLLDVVAREVAGARESRKLPVQLHGSRGAGDRRPELLQLGFEVLPGRAGVGDREGESLRGVRLRIDAGAG